MHDYQPIACSLYDYLELLIMKKQRVHLIFKDDKIETRLLDIFTKEGVEYTNLESGETIRLDTILKIDNLITGEFIQCKS